MVSPAPRTSPARRRTPSAITRCARMQRSPAPPPPPTPRSASADTHEEGGGLPRRPRVAPCCVPTYGVGGGGQSGQVTVRVVASALPLARPVPVTLAVSP